MVGRARAVLRMAEVTWALPFHASGRAGGVAMCERYFLALTQVRQGSDTRGFGGLEWIPSARQFVGMTTASAAAHSP
jgi:hypothetical protein